MVDRGATPSQVVSAWWHDRVFVTITAVAVMAWLGAVGLMIKWSFLLHKLAVPLTVWLYSRPGHVLTPKGVEEFQHFFSMLAAAAGVTGGVALGYACLWRYLCRRLPMGAPSMRVSATASLSTLEWYCLAAVCVLGVILRLYHITRGLTLDELTTVITFVDVPSLWTTMSVDHGFNNHLANSLLASLSQRLLGRSEWVLRLPAFLLGLSSLYSLWAFTRRLSGPALAVLATAGLAFSPAHIFWSVTARGYMGMLLFTLISTSLYWQILHSPSWRKGLLFTLSSVLAICFHLFAVLVVFTQLVFLLYLAVREMTTGRSGRILSVGSYRTLYLAFPVIVGMSFACYAPMLPQYVFNVRTAKHGALHLWFPLEVLALFSYGRVRSSLGWWWVLVGGMGSLCAVGWIAFRRKCARIANYWACLAILPFLIVIPARPYYLVNRFFLFLLPFYLILVGEGLLTAWQAATTRPARASRSVLQSCCLCVAAAMLGSWLWRVWIDYPRLEHGFREAAWAMESAATPEMGLCSFGWASSHLQYYLRRDLFIPRNWDDFDRFARRYPSIMCADASAFDSARAPAYIRDIGAFLARHAASHEFYRIIVYTYNKAP